MSNIYDELEYRGLIAQVSSPELKERLNKPITLYCGFDPTAQSLHVGNMMPIITLRRFQQMGHTVIAVAGGSTGLIGDPRMSGERTLNSEETVKEYREAIEAQIKKFLDPEKTIFVNNYDWTHDISILDFLRDYGKFFNINYLLNKETIKSRLDSGISFTEFTYTMLQALDYKHLYETYNCQLEIGGSDQWGNLTSGLELIHRSLGHEEEVYALTTPLVTKNDGTKFGKSEGGAIWIDEKLTSPYELYQFFFNSADEDVIKYIKYFTFLDKESIEQLVFSVENEPHLRLAQKALAKEMVILIHGEDAYYSVIEASDALFSGDITQLTDEHIESYFKDIEITNIDYGSNIVDVLIESKLASSKREAREFISNNAISLNANKIDSVDYVVKIDENSINSYVFIKRGKKKFAILKVN